MIGKNDERVLANSKVTVIWFIRLVEGCGGVIKTDLSGGMKFFQDNLQKKKTQNNKYTTHFTPGIWEYGYFFRKNRPNKSGTTNLFPAVLKGSDS
jgi:hypothetical protein